MSEGAAGERTILRLVVLLQTHLPLRTCDALGTGDGEIIPLLQRGAMVRSFRQFTARHPLVDMAR